jgi:hypothetical protein
MKTETKNDSHNSGTIETATKHAKPSGPWLDTQRALAAGWTPDAMQTPKALACEAGCGRAVVHDAGDPTCGYCCPYCAASIRGFLARRKASRKAD